LIVKPQVLEIVEGNIPESIHCQSTARPVPSYRWERHGIPIALKSVLEFQNPVSANSSGNYSCISFNRHGSAKIDAIINVLRKSV
jgi:PREDICTED: similar to neuromusculin